MLYYCGRSDIFVTPEVNVENIVSTVALGREIDLRELVARIRGVEYNPENFPGAILRIKDLRVSFLLFKSGKCVLTGAKSQESIVLAVRELVRCLNAAGIEVEKTPDYEIENIVSSSSLGFRVDLDRLAIESFNAEYEPEQFPGLVLRLDNPRTAVLVFNSGKIIVVGARRVEDVILASEKTMENIRTHNAIIQ
jgi:transcription initiation factor TFIID TATA-box-binding protein